VAGIIGLALLLAGTGIVLRAAVADPQRSLPLVPSTDVATDPAAPRDGLAIRLLGTTVRRVTAPARIAKIERDVRRAGSPQGVTVDRLLAFKALAVVVLGGFGVLWVAAQPTIFSVSAATFLVVGGWAAPGILLTNRAEAHQEAVRASLPDAIDQLPVTVRAGLSLDAALLRVSRTLRGPLADELAHVVQDVQLGASRSDALRTMAARLDVPELNSFVRAVVQADSLGVPVSTTLMLQANEMRISRRQRSEEMAMKLPVKILAPTALCILPAIMAVVLGPAVIQLARTLGS
jgi:tight adherence protein C